MAEMPREYRQLYTSKAGASATDECERMGCTHAEVGAYLISIWGLPLPLVHAVAYHHHPGETGDAKFSTLTAVHVADAIVSECDPSPLNHDAELDAQYLNPLGLADRLDAWRGIYKDSAAKSASTHQ